MAIQWSNFALQSLEEIIAYYELQGGRRLADRALAEIWDQVEASNLFPKAMPLSDVLGDVFPGMRKLVISTFPYVAFLRQLDDDLWEVVDVVHTSRKLPKNS